MMELNNTMYECVQDLSCIKHEFPILLQRKKQITEFLLTTDIKNENARAPGASTYQSEACGFTF